MVAADVALSISAGPSFDEFILQGFDPTTRTVRVEWRVRIADIDALREIFAPDCDEDRDLRWTYHGISRRDMRRIGQLCLPPVVPDDIYTSIGRRSELFDNVPYMIHTGFELPLMLEGRKPFAAFADGYPSEWFDDYLAPFEPFVERGAIIRRIIDTPMPQRTLRRPALEGFRSVLFALPGEEWRIDAYVTLMDEAKKSGWNDSRERRQGCLLGYEDWQNDWWIEQIVKRRDDALASPRDA